VSTIAYEEEEFHISIMVRKYECQDCKENERALYRQLVREHMMRQGEN
jgi:hypothetical protein